MAINKKLIHFKKEASFKPELDSGNILQTSIVFIQDTKKIWTHGQYYNYDDSTILEKINSLTKNDVGLSNVDNTSDTNKPVSTAQAAAIKVVQDDLISHKNNETNPHKVTKSQVGLGNVDNTSDLNKPISTATQDALTTLDQHLAQEMSDRQTEDSEIKTSITTEISERKAADAKTLSDAKSYTDETVLEEITNRTNADTALDEKKLNKSDVIQDPGQSTEKVMSQKAVTQAISNIEEYQQKSLLLILNGAQDQKNVSLVNKTLCIQPNGFGIIYDRVVYYIADTTKEKTEPFTFPFDTDGQHFKVIDTTALTVADGRNDPDTVIVDRNFTELQYTDIPICYYCNWYPHEPVFIGKFNDFFGTVGVKQDESTNKEYPNKELFLPEFYAYKWGRINNSKGEGTSWKKRFVITHISDSHAFNNQLKEALVVSKNISNLIVHTGDNANGHPSTSTSKARVPTEIQSMLNVVAENNNSTTPFVCARGNHDVPGMPQAQWYTKIRSTLSSFGNLHFGAVNRGYYYVDVNNFRIIMLDPSHYDDDKKDTTYSWTSAVFSQVQIDWLIATLEDACALRLNVITAMHYGFGDNSLTFNDVKCKPDCEFYQDPFMIPDIIDALQNKTTLRKTYPDSKGINNITLNCDFTNSDDFKYVAHLFGHIHSKNHHRCQKTDGSKKYNILMLGETSLSAPVVPGYSSDTSSAYHYAYDATHGYALNRIYKDYESTNDIAFSVLVIDTDEKAIYRVSYGAYLNYDRSNYERTTKFTYNFTN